MNHKNLQETTVRMHQLVHELVKKYQFRDRNQICCYDISVSQCYIMYELKPGGLRMQVLADRMHLDISTMTRVVDQLQKKRYTRRQSNPKDRRIVNVFLTEKGRVLLEKIENGIIETDRTILEKVSPEVRESILLVLKELLSSVEGWRQACCLPREQGKKAAA